MRSWGKSVPSRELAQNVHSGRVQHEAKYREDFDLWNLDMVFTLHPVS